MIYRPSLREVFEIASERHLRRYKNAQVAEIHGDMRLMGSAVEIDWLPPQDTPNLEIFTRETILYPSIRKFSMMHTLGVSVIEHRKRQNALVMAQNVSAVELEPILKEVILPIPLPIPEQPLTSVVLEAQ